VKFSWDEKKAKSNLIKHQVSFEEAKRVFWDESARLIEDPDHSQYEDRFLIIGMSVKFRILTVVHCYRENDEVIRIISARKATKREVKQYKEFLL